MSFKMDAVIHRGSDYKSSLYSFQNQRMEFLEQELRSFDSELLWLLLRQLCRNGRTLDSITGLAI